MFDRLRRYLEGFPKRQAARDALPAWAKIAGSIIVPMCLLFVSAALFRVCVAAHQISHPEIPFGKIPGPAAGAMALSSIFMAIPLALILSNVVLWLVRPLRHAHQTAFDGVLSFRQGNYQLALTALVFLPFFLIAATVGIWDPWLAP